MFCAVGHHGLRTTSSDGVNWSEPILHDQESLHLKTLVYGGGQLFAFGQYGAIGYYMISRDGKEWEEHGFNAGYTFKGTFTWYQGKFIHSGGKGTSSDVKPYIRTSKNGVDWSKEIRISGTRMLRRFAEGNGRLVGVGEYGRRSWSKDGVEWTDIPGVRPLDTLIDVCFGNGMFVGGGLHGMRMSSKDGETWSDPIPGKEGEHINSIRWDGKRFVGVGQGATYVSPDGLEWERIPNKDAAIVSTFGNGIWVGSIWRGKIQTSKDAVQWQTAVDFGPHVEAIARAPV